MHNIRKRLALYRWRRYLSRMSELAVTLQKDPVSVYRRILNWPARHRARQLAVTWQNEWGEAMSQTPSTLDSNPLWAFFIKRNEGKGILKSRHYFEIYHRHLAGFVESPVKFVEVGVLAGGSLEMWSAYLGPESHVHGIDINPKCLRPTQDNIHIHIGDQRSRQFWSQFRESVGPVDILIDDGGHQPEQQMVTLEEMLPSLRPGGVFICEDIRGINNAFAAFALELTDHLNYSNLIERRYWGTSPFQQAIHSIHFYPFVVVIEKHLTPLSKINSFSQGSEWPNYVQQQGTP